MQPLYQEDGWTVVTRRRGRANDRSRQPPGHQRPYQRRQSLYPTRPSYAAVLQRGQPFSRGQYISADNHRYDNTSRSRFTDVRQPRDARRERAQTYSNGPLRTGPTWRTGPGTGQRGVHSRPRHPRPTSHRRQRPGRPTGGDRRAQGWVDTDDADFTYKVRVVYKIIKSQHHLCNVTGPNPPPFIRKTTTNLSSFIKPAFPSDLTRTQLQGNARNWEYSTMLILRQHYEDSLSEDIIELAGLSAGDWQGPFRIAEGWARKNLGRRLTQQTLIKAKTFISNNLTPPPPPTTTQSSSSPLSSPAAAPPSSSAPAAAVQPLASLVAPATHHNQGAILDTTAAERTTETAAPATAEPPASHRETDIRALVHTAPVSPPQATKPPADKMSVATMTEPPRSDWSPLLDPQGDETTHPPAASPVIILPPLPPLPPRSTPRRAQPTPFSSPLLPLSSPIPQVTPGTPALQRSSLPPPSRHTPNSCVHTGDLQVETETQTPPPRPPCLTSPRVQQQLLAHSLVPKLKRRVSKGPPLPLPSLDQTGEEDTSPEERSEDSPHRPITPRGTPDPEPLVPTRPTEHPRTHYKVRDWGLTASHKCLILGDSNLAKIPHYSLRDVQIDSFPGATFKHAYHILEKAVLTDTVDTVILAFGINHRKQSTAANTTELLKAVTMAETRFPGARILVPLVNCSTSLPSEDRRVIQVLNNHIQSDCKPIPLLPLTDFCTAPDNIHWTPSTAVKMLNHWMVFLN